MPIEGNDELLVNRSGTTYTLEQQNLMAEIQNDDLLLVNRDGNTYTATGLELVDSVKTVLLIITSSSFFTSIMSCCWMTVAVSEALEIVTTLPVRFCLS